MNAYSLTMSAGLLSAVTLAIVTIDAGAQTAGTPRPRSTVTSSPSCRRTARTVIARVRSPRCRC